MQVSSKLLNQSVDRAARVVALELLEKAAKERTRLNDSDDAEALHDFRVAVRRLRSWLRALGPWLEDSTPKKARRRLKKAARVTGASRDAEVHLQWLDEQTEHLSSRQRPGHRCVTKQIKEERRECHQRVVNGGARAFDRASATLSRKLHCYRVDIEDGGEDTPPLFAAEMARLIVVHGTSLAECLAQVKTVRDAKRGHEARIAGKRLRYLVEVVVSCVGSGEDLVKELGEMQDLLGDWHDADVFCESIADIAAAGCGRDRDDSAPGVSALTRRLETRGRRAFKQFKSRWPDARAFQPQVEAVAGELSGAGQSEFENERKYLLARLSELPNERRTATSGSRKRRRVVKG